MFSCTDDPGSSVGQLKLCCVGCVACANTWLHEGEHAQPPQPQPHEPTVKRSLPGPSLQWLNVGIFKAIGHAGVYYGFKLGHTVPWVSGFPFNVVSHPQYVGSVATVLGGAALVSPKLLGSLGSAVLSSELQPCLPSMQHGSKVPVAAVLGGSAVCPLAVLASAASASEARFSDHPAVHQPSAPCSHAGWPVQVWTQAPQGLGLLVLYWTLLYVVTAIQEDKCHVD